MPWRLSGTTMMGGFVSTAVLGCAQAETGPHSPITVIPNMNKERICFIVLQSFLLFAPASAGRLCLPLSKGHAGPGGPYKSLGNIRFFDYRRQTGACFTFLRWVHSPKLHLKDGGYSPGEDS